MGRIVKGLYVPSAWDEIEPIIKRLTRFQDELFTFLDHPEVTADNNRAEREIRPAVLSRKVSFGNHSQKGADTQAILMTIIRTAQLQGHDPKDLINHILISYIKTGTVPHDILRPQDPDFPINTNHIKASNARQPQAA